MRLIELYKSVQGESSFTGLPCIFVRFAGCNLRCAWCDSTYTFTGGKPFTEDEVVEQIRALAPCTLVEFTGGEPMLHERELLPLMDRLLSDPAHTYTLMMETSGERPLQQVPPAVHKIVDVKCPGSGSAFGSFRMSNLETLTRRDEVKFVLRDRRDYEFARDFIREHLAAKVDGVQLGAGPGGVGPANADGDAGLGGILLSPAFLQSPSPLRTADNMELDARALVQWMLDDGLPARLSLQVHKFVWEPQKKGV